MKAYPALLEKYSLKSLVFHVDHYAVYYSLIFKKWFTDYHPIDPCHWTSRGSNEFLAHWNTENESHTWHWYELCGTGIFSSGFLQPQVSALGIKGNVYLKTSVQYSAGTVPPSPSVSLSLFSSNLESLFSPSAHAHMESSLMTVHRRLSQEYLLSLKPWSLAVMTRTEPSAKRMQTSDAGGAVY